MEQKRRLPQNKTNIHLRLFNSPVQPPSKLGKRERELELRNLGVSEIAMEQKRRLPQNNTNIHLLCCVHQSSPACEAFRNEISRPLITDTCIFKVILQHVHDFLCPLMGFLQFFEVGMGNYSIIVKIVAGNNYFYFVCKIGRASCRERV